LVFQPHNATGSSIRGRIMHEVKVYDSSGNLKKIISVKKLELRSKKQLESPNLFRRNKKAGKPPKENRKPKINSGTLQTYSKEI
jgi:hypothetical protein